MKLNTKYAVFFVAGILIVAIIRVGIADDMGGKNHSKVNELDEIVSCTIVNDNLMFHSSYAKAQYTNSAVSAKVYEHGKCDFLRTITAGIELNYPYTEEFGYPYKEIEKHLFSISVSSKTKKEVFDEIVRQNPGYVWREINGVINIRPYDTSKASTSVSVLDKTIPSFEVHGVSLDSALEKLVEVGVQNNIALTTVRRVMVLRRGLKLPSSEEIDKKRFKHLDPKELLDVSIKHEVTIRNCLNLMVLKSPTSKWFSFPYGNNTFIIIESTHYYHEPPSSLGNVNTGPDLFEALHKKPKKKN